MHGHHINGCFLIGDQKQVVVGIRSSSSSSNSSSSYSSRSSSGSSRSSNSIMNTNFSLYFRRILKIIKHTLEICGKPTERTAFPANSQHFGAVESEDSREGQRRLESGGTGQATESITALETDRTHRDRARARRRATPVVIITGGGEIRFFVCWTISKL